MGETADVKDAPFARHTVASEDELPHALRPVGLACEHVTTAVVTHLHPDHFHGACHLATSVLVNEAEWADATSFRGRVIQRLPASRCPVIDFQPVALDDGSFGAFSASRQLTTDGRVLLVSTPGHTRDHTSVIADDDGWHVLIAGDTTDTLEQLHARRPDAITSDPVILAAPSAIGRPPVPPMSVATHPGQTALTRACPWSSAASLTVSMFSAAFETL